MSAVNEWLVREYFEMLGFLVCQPRKHNVPGRSKTAAEELDLLLVNPRRVEHHISEALVWNSADLRSVARAAVAVRGWHTERFYASSFEDAPDILNFAAPAAIKYAETILGPGPLAKVLCLPRLPASGELKARTIAVLRAKGIDGILSFETILTELTRRVDVNRNYEKSDVLQVLRILKSYNMLHDRQMDLFSRRARRARRVETKPEAARHPIPPGA